MTDEARDDAPHPALQRNVKDGRKDYFLANLRIGQNLLAPSAFSEPFTKKLGGLFLQDIAEDQ